MSTTTSSKPSLILASTSPRRRELLGLLGLEFEATSPQVDEAPLPDEAPDELVMRLSRLKAASVAGNPTCPGVPVVAADTIVVFRGRVIGKPGSPDEAVDILRMLRGRHHMVYSGVTVMLGAHGVTDLARTRVIMRDYPDSEIEAYVATGDPLDKGGAYAIQNTGFSPVKAIEGCWANVMGLPLCHLARLLSQFGVALPNDVPAACQAFVGIKCEVYGEIIG